MRRILSVLLENEARYDTVKNRFIVALFVDQSEEVCDRGRCLVTGCGSLCATQLQY